MSALDTRDSKFSEAASAALQCQRTIQMFYTDPITVEYGVGTELGGLVARKALDEFAKKLQALGYTPQSFLDELDARVSQKYAYQSGLAHVAGELTAA
jgi:hypothetical protein